MAKVVTKKNDDILVISDLHCPAHHSDALEFLYALKKKYEFGRIICIGDETDWHSMSYHEHNPDLPSAGDELEMMRGFMRELYKLFPIMDLIESNHGSLTFRKAMSHGMPKHAMTSYGDMYFGERDKWGNLYRPHTLGIGWHWHDKLVVDLGSGHKCLFVHGDGVPANTLTSVKQAGASIVYGHHHSRFDIQYHSTSEFLHFGMAVGCLVQPKHAAFQYGHKRILARPVIGCGGIINGQPRLFPMQLSDGGKWTGLIP